MDNKNIEDVLQKMGDEPLPNNLDKLAENAVRKFTKSIAPAHSLFESLAVKLALAAAIIILVIGGISFWLDSAEPDRWWSGPPSVWSDEILDNLDKVDTIAFRQRLWLACLEELQLIENTTSSPDGRNASVQTRCTGVIDMMTMIV